MNSNANCVYQPLQQTESGMNNCDTSCADEGASRTCASEVGDTVKQHDTSNTFVAVPPPYQIASVLPTYDEAARIKSQEDEVQNCNETATPAGGNILNHNIEVGSDSGFIIAFILALMFNWIGFIIAFCVSNTYAGRYGAISGFGLSLVKWTFIMSHSEYIMKHDASYWVNAWIQWLMIVLGLTIFIRGIFMYIRTKQLFRLGQNDQLSMFYY